MNYIFKGLNNKGRLEFGRLYGERERIKQSLIYKGYREIKIFKENKYLTRIIYILNYRTVKIEELINFTKQFSILIKSGISIIKILDILEAQNNNNNFKYKISIIKKDIQMGVKLSDAMEKHKDIFSYFYINMIRVGEKTGRLDKILEKIYISLIRTNSIRKRIKKAFIYPGILLISIVLVSIFIIRIILPDFLELHRDTDSILPGSTQFLLDIFKGINKYWLVIVIISIIFIIILYINNKREDIFNILDFIKLKFPIYNNLYIKINISEFIRSLAILNSSGVSLISSISISTSILKNNIMKNDLNNSLNRIKQGERLSNSISDIHYLPKIIEDMLRLGEESGDLENILIYTSELLDDQIDIKLERLSILLEPAIIIIMAIIIGFVIIAMILPMFNIIDMI